VQIFLPDEAALDGLVGEGYDFAEYLDTQDDGRLRANIYATDAELDGLRARGFEIGETIETTETRAQRMAEREQQMAQEELAENRAENGAPHARSFAPTGEVTLQRADYFTNARAPAAAGARVR
jgi:hypothetical protein